MHRFNTIAKNLVVRDNNITRKIEFVRRRKKKKKVFFNDDFQTKYTMLVEERTHIDRQNNRKGATENKKRDARRPIRRIRLHGNVLKNFETLERAIDHRTV